MECRGSRENRYNNHQTQSTRHPTLDPRPSRDAGVLHVRQDVRRALRLFRMEPAFTAAAPIAGCAGGSVTLCEENDDISLRGNGDRWYTQGIRLTRTCPAEACPTAEEFARSLPRLRRRVKRVIPLDQFLWSPHVEAVALLEKPKRRR